MSIRKMKILKIVTILFVMFISITTVKAASAAIPTYYVDDGYEVDSSYGWSYKFISGVTTVEAFGFDSIDYFDSNGTSTNYYGLIINSSTNYGNCGVIYHNVGTYKGQTISLKITLMSVGGYQKSGTVTVNGTTYTSEPTIYFKKTAISIHPTTRPAIVKPVYKFEFILEDTYVDYNTYETVVVKGHETAYDLDGSSARPTTPGETLTFSTSNGIDSVYLTSDTYIGVNDLSYYGTTDSSGNDSTYAWVTMLFETDSFQISYFDYTSTVIDTTTVPTTRSTYMFGMTQKTVLSFSTPELLKAVSTDSINGQDSFEYILDFYVPYQMSDYYYTTLDLEDTYSSVLDIESVKVENDLGEDVTSNFSISYSNGNLSVVANNSMLSDSDSYNVNYTVVVTCKINESTSTSDLASYLSENKTYYTIPNSATLTTNVGSSTDTVNTILAVGNVQVKYVDKNSGIEIENTITIDGYEGKEYETEQKYITGYVYSSVSGNVSGTMSSGTTTVIYYYIKESDVTVKYVDYYNQDTEIATGKSTTYLQGDVYLTQQKAVEGYTYYTDTNNTNGTVGAEDIEVIYYYKKQSDVTVKYVDYYNQDTEIAIGKSDTYLQGDPYTTEQKAVEGYAFYTDTNNTSGTVEAENIEVIYYYKKQSNLITEHIDANSGEKIIDDVVKTYNERDKWESYAQNFEGYVLVESPDITTGIMEREDITKTYYYKKISAGLVVKYVDVITEGLLDQETYDGNEKDTITLDEKTFKYYVIYSRPNYTTVDLTVEAQEVIYYYIRIADVDILGIDKDTGKTLYETSKSGLEGDEYTTTPRNIKGYELVTIPENQNGILYRDSDPVIYEYRKVSSGVTVKYIDKDTDKELADTVTISGLYGDGYKTEEKEIEDYELVEVVGDTSGTLEVEEKEVIYYYEKKTGQVIVKYEDQDGNALVTEEMSAKVGEKYETKEKEIEGYKLVEIPENATGTYIDGIIEVTYVYKKLGTIIVKFVDSDGNEIAESITTENVVGEEYYLEAPQIDGYTIVGDTYVSTTYIDEELVYIIEYEKIVEETVETGDVQVISLLIIFISSVMMSIIYTLKIKKE